MASDREAALADFKRMMKWIVLAGVAMAAGALVYIHLFVPLNTTIVIATILGVFFSVLLGCGLFAAAFFSEKSGLDDEVANATRSKPRSARISNQRSMK